MLMMFFEGVFRLNTKPWMIPLSALCIMGLAGCANSDRAGVNNNNINNVARPMGYYSNEKHPNNTNGFLIDNDGPLTEMMDHTLGGEGKFQRDQRRQVLQTRDENGNPPNPTKPLANHDHNFFMRDNRFSTGDVNYHNHLNVRYTGNDTAHDSATLGRITNQIKQKAESVNNVQNVHSVIYGNSVLITIDLVDHSRAVETKRAVQKAVKPYVNGKKVSVITDEGTFSRDRNTTNELLEGKQIP